MIIQRIRAATRTLHDRIERVIDLASLCASLEAYRALLARLLGFHEPFEEQLSRFDWRPAGLDFAARRKTPWLRADLAALGLDEAGIAGLPVCRDLPRPVSLAGGLGCLYVLEGSTLGGQVVARELEGGLGIGAETGGRFHHGYGHETGSLWNAFRAAAETYCGEEEDRIAAAVSAAAATFESFEAWLISK